MDEAIDETGTVPCSIVGDDLEGRVNVEEQLRKEIREVSDYLLEVHGVPPGRKGEGITRLIYENLNGLQSTLSNKNEKLEKARRVIDDLQADVVCYNEHRQNLRHKANRNGFRQMFNGGETDLRAIASHNVHESVGKYQEGGTAVLSYGNLIQQFDPEGSGRDDLGLGRWTYMRFVGEDRIVTRIICGYSPCANKKKDSGTVYQQHRRHLINRLKDDTCPRVRFREDLLRQMKRWRKDGERLILCVDANENIYRGELGRQLTDLDGLGMKEVVGEFTARQLGATYFRGSEPIDGVWTTGDITVTNACVMPVGFGVGDHRLFVIDFATTTLVGSGTTTVVRPALRRLNTKIHGCADRYNKSLRRNILRHRLLERMVAVASVGNSKSDMAQTLNKLDQEGEEYMKHAEKKCRRLKSGRIPFSPEASLWIRQCQVYRSLLRWHNGKLRNYGNLCRTARRCQINAPFQLTVDDIKLRMVICKEKCDYFRKHGQRHRRQHLTKCLEAAQDREDETAEQHILAIMKREKDKAFWRRLNYALGKHVRGQSVRAVQVEDGAGGVLDFDTEEAVQEAIFNEVHRKRYNLAEEAPICQGALRGQFGYTATSPTAQSVLDGTYEFPPEMDAATRELFEEIANIRDMVPSDSVNGLISQERWQQRWKKVKEDTSSSQSGLHFGHYIAGTDCDYISQFHALRVSLALKKGIALERWSKGLSVMLEKMFGVRLVSKLRAILLMEADFNAMNKEVYGVRMMDNARRYKLIPEEIFSEQNRTADDGGLAKTLFYDIARQMRTPAAIASVDASNCYDRIAHAMASLIFQSFGVESTAVSAMLETIQEMKFFLRTAYGDSKTFAGSSIEIKTQGLGQGNGAAPAGWCVISIVILRAHGAKGHGAHFMAPMTLVRRSLSAILYVDDTDLLHINMDAEESIVEVHAAIQRAIENWGRLLIATGGTLKPDKCFYHLLDFAWTQKGGWQYIAHHEDECAALFVPLPDGTMAPIAHLAVDDAQKTLGVTTCPSGNSIGSLRQMKVKAKKWFDSLTAGRLHRRMMWFSVDRQMWPSVKYGLCCSMATLSELDSVLMPLYGKMLPLGGIVSKANRGIRQLDHGFYGAGFPHPGVEATLEQTNKLLMHYGCQTALGTELQTSLELLVVDLGLSFQPFQVSYEHFGDWVTTSWLKRVWEKVSFFGFTLSVNNMPACYPREGDDWLMSRFIARGYTANELATLNRVRKHQQVLFLSDILGAGGGSVDKRYLQKRRAGECWSSMKFPREVVTAPEMELWCRALVQVVTQGPAQISLGSFKVDGHKLWEWRVVENRGRLYRQNGDQVEVYGHVRRGRYKRLRTSRSGKMRGAMATVEEGTPGTKKVCSVAHPPIRPIAPTDFMDVLRGWGQTWIWDGLKVTGSTEWLAQAIADNSLVAATDGSYIKEHHPELCSAAFVLECNKSRGRLVGAFAEASVAANAYRGELLGLMAVHLLLLAVETVSPGLRGCATIYSDCLGALGRVAKLPPYRIPTRCRHSDILKTIMVNCANLSFQREYLHVAAHQDDHTRWEDMSRAAQLNSACDAGAKAILRSQDVTNLPQQEAFPLEPICMFVEGKKMTSDTGAHIRYAAGRQIARSFFHQTSRMFTDAFDEVDWPHVHRTLNEEVPRLFQVWACKQVMNIAATNKNLSRRHRDGRSDKCPCCTIHVETAAHVLLCPEVGRVEAFQLGTTALEQWLEEADTDPDLTDSIVEYVQRRGAISMEEATIEAPPRFRHMALSQDKIGWRRFLEGMISTEITFIQRQHIAVNGSRMSLDKWCTGLITRLLEITHGQWLYRNYIVHDPVSGIIATARKEELLVEIERQRELGDTGLLEEDKYLAEVNLEEMSTSSGERHHYWLLAIQTARNHYALRAQRESQQMAQSDTTGEEGR